MYMTHGKLFFVVEKRGFEVGDLFKHISPAVQCNLSCYSDLFVVKVFVLSTNLLNLWTGLYMGVFTVVRSCLDSEVLSHSPSRRQQAHADIRVGQVGGVPSREPAPA